MEREEERPSQEGSHGHSIKPEDAVPDEASSPETGRQQGTGTDHVVEEKGRVDEGD